MPDEMESTENKKMIGEREQLRQRLKQLDDEIAETLRRLPAHSVKFPIMNDLLELEDERELLLKRLQELGSGSL